MVSDEDMFRLLMRLLNAELRRTKCAAEAYQLGAEDCKDDALYHQQLAEVKLRLSNNYARRDE